MQTKLASAISDKPSETPRINPTPDSTGPTSSGLPGLLLCILLSSLATSIANIALPTFTHVFSASFQEVQWIVIAYLLGTTTAIVSVGKLGDMMGGRRLLRAGILLFIAASFLCGFANSLWQLIALRFVQGVAGAMLLALSMALASKGVSKSRSGRAMGWIGTSSAIGTALGPTLGGILIETFGWQSIFMINVPLGLGAWMLVNRGLLDDQPVKSIPSKFDFIGTILLAFALSTFALSLTLGRGKFGTAHGMLLLMACVGLCLFIRWEKACKWPLIRMSIFNEPGLKTSLIMTVLVSAVIMATLVVGPFYLSRGLGFGTAVVGVIMSIGPVVVGFAGVPSGWSVDKFGTVLTTRLALLIVASGCFILAIMPLTFGWPGYIMGVGMITAGYAQFQTANNSAALSNTSTAERGAVSGILNLSRNVGLLAGTALMGTAFEFGSRISQAVPFTAEGVSAGLRTTFGFAFLLILVALGIHTQATIENGGVRSLKC